LCCVCLAGACALSCSGRLEADDTSAPVGGSNGTGAAPPSAGSGNPIGVAGTSTSPNGSGGSGNGSEDPGDLPMGGADVELSADAQLMPLQGGSVTGSVHFAQLGTKVDMTVTLSSCPAGLHALHIHANAACGDNGNAAGGHWQPQHDGIGDISCGDDGSAQYSFTPPDGTWSIGGPASTNLLGHALILHAGPNQPDPGGRIACGIPAIPD
jgi:Cu/Zn superoxide dismutase